MLRGALWAIAARITEFGFSPNRVAALGENAILLINLALPKAVSYLGWMVLGHLLWSVYGRDGAFRETAMDREPAGEVEG